MKLTRVLIIVMLLSVFLTPQRSARADGAPPPPTDIGGLQPFAYQKTEVQMMYERVEIDTYNVIESEFSSSFWEKARVTAWFVMHNQGNVTENMQVAFPLEGLLDCLEGFALNRIDMETFEVSVDGTTIPVKLFEGAHPYKDKYEPCQAMNWAGFDVTFPVDQDVLIKINYEIYLNNTAIGIVGYTLETGAGWKGPIERVYIIVRFPYMVSKENILTTSPAKYQFLYNEIFWSFQSLEPTSHDNIQLSFIPTHTWQDILHLRQILEQNPRLPDVWKQLIDHCDYLAHNNRKEFAMPRFLDTIEEIYGKAIAANPDNPDLYANYAEFLMEEWAPLLMRPLNRDEVQKLLPLVNKALSLDSTNRTALQMLSYLKSFDPQLTYTPPPTIPSTATPLVSATPTLTPTETITPRGYQPSPTPTNEPTETLRPSQSPKPSFTPSITPSPTQTLIPPTPTPIEQPKSDNTLPLFAGMLVIFIAGIGAGYFIRNPNKNR